MEIEALLNFRPKFCLTRGTGLSSILGNIFFSWVLKYIAWFWLISGGFGSFRSVSSTLPISVLILSELINFYSTGNHQKIIVLWWFQGNRSSLIRVSSLNSRNNTWRWSPNKVFKYIWCVARFGSIVQFNKREKEKDFNYVSDRAKQHLQSFPFEKLGRASE